MVAFRVMGSNAVPFLIKILERKPTKLSEFGDKAVSELNDKPQLQKFAEELLPSAYKISNRREFAAFLLSEIGTDAGAALPTLIKIFEDQTEDRLLRSKVYGALHSLGENGAAMVPRYMEYLKSDSAETRTTGADLLASVGPKAKAAIPMLTELIDGNDWQLRWSAAWALWRIGRETNVALRVFAPGLDTTNFLRSGAIFQFREMGPAAKPVAQKIVVALRDEDEQVREGAVQALREIDPELLESWLRELSQQTAANIAHLIEMIRNGEFRKRCRAIEAITLFGPDAKHAVPVLIQALDAPVAVMSPSFAETAKHHQWRITADALGEIGPAASAAVPKLLELIQKSKHFAAMSYCPALGKIGTNAHPAVPLLRSLLQDEDRRLRLAAADALTRIAPLECSNVVAVLTNLQHDSEAATVWLPDGRRSERKDFQNPQSVFLRLSASVALWRLGVEKEPPVDALAELAGKSPSIGGELWAIKSLGEIGPRAKVALPALRVVLERERGSSVFGRAAAIAIRRIDPEEFAKLGLPGLLALP